MKLDLALQIDSEVGEGPVWDAEREELIWIDVTQGLIHRFNPESRSNRSISLGCHIGAVGLLDDASYIAAVRDGFAFIDISNGAIEYLAKVLDDDGIRFNDGKCDPFGNFVAGTMRYEPKPGSAELYSCNARGEVRTILSGVGLSNGLCWDESGSTLFYIDTLTNEVVRFAYDASGIVGSRQVVYRFAGVGSPDGMTIDCEGNLWIALWGGGKVVSIDQRGQLVRELAMPVSQPTSVIFGGTNLDQLFITSANYQLSKEARAQEPLAGSLFVADVGTCGALEPRFAR